MRKFLRLKTILCTVVGIAFMAVPTTGYADTSMDGMSAPKTSAPNASMEGVTSHDMPEHSSAPGPSFDRDTALKISRDAIGNMLPNYTFTNSMGQAVSLSDFAGKPVLINLIYTSCMHTCPMIVETLSRSVDVAREALGQDSFTVLTIGFDTQIDTPERMAGYARMRHVGDENWFLLSGDETTVQALADDLGFQFYRSPTGFDHLAQVSVIDEASVVYRQIYGVRLTVPVVVEPLKQLVFGRKTGYTSFTGLSNQVKLFCTIYDPSTGRYHFDPSFIISIALGLLFLSGVAIVFIRSWWSFRKREKAI